MRRLLLVVSLLVVILAGCSSDGSGSLRWRSTVEMTDTAASYDLWMMLRVSSRNTENPVPIFISVESPDGKFAARDTFEVIVDREWIDANGNREIRCCMSALSCDVECLYRRDVSPITYGGWNVILESGTESVSDIRMRAVKK